MENLERAYRQWAVHSNTKIEYLEYFNTLLDKIVKNEKFTFVRICDMEYYLLVNNKCHDGQLNSEDVVKVNKSLNNLISLHSSNLLIGIQFGTKYDIQYSNYINTVLKDIKARGYSGALFSWATVTGNMLRLFTILNSIKRPIIIIGPEYLKGLSIRCIKYTNFITVPERRSWDSQDAIESELDALIKKLKNKSPILLYSCSVTAKMAIERNYVKYGNSITQLDLGANLNPYVARFIRCWQEEVYKDYIGKSL